MQISIKHNITEFYVAFTNKLIVIGTIAIITELMFVGFSNFSFSRYERNVEFINNLYRSLSSAFLSLVSLFGCNHRIHKGCVHFLKFVYF